MTQYARPDSDISGGDWYNSDDDQDDLFSFIDEASVSDDDWIYAQDYGSGSECTLGLGDVTDPSSASDHKFTVRSDETSGVGAVTITATLLQGSTTIRAVTWTPDYGFGNVTTTLTASEANAITDYTDLRLKLRAVDQMGMGNEGVVSWAYFECPDAASSAVSNPAFLLFVD